MARSFGPVGIVGVSRPLYSETILPSGAFAFVTFHYYRNINQIEPHGFCLSPRLQKQWLVPNPQVPKDVNNPHEIKSIVLL